MALIVIQVTPFGVREGHFVPRGFTMNNYYLLSNSSVLSAYFNHI